MNSRPTRPIALYRFPLSGHAHRVELFLSLLGLPYRLIEVDLRAGQQKTPEFLRKNPLGKVPVIEDGDFTLADSNAILVYLALRYDAERRFWPEDAQLAARVQGFLSLAAGPLANGPSALRLRAVFGAKVDVDVARSHTTALFDFFERELSQHAFLVGDRPSLSDIANYTYTAHVPEGGFSLEPYPAIRAWLSRIEALPGFIPMARPGT